ncbi:MAG: cyclic nucleotide-binding domain-containing protein [Geodermatophilaceae bacterium]
MTRSARASCCVERCSHGQGRSSRSRSNSERPSRSRDSASGALRSLAGAAKSVEHAEGHNVVEEGGTPLGFHLITEGEAIVEVGGQERRRLGAGDSFGLVSLIDGKPRSATVRTTAAMRTLFISPWVFGPMLDGRADDRAGSAADAVPVAARGRAARLTRRPCWISCGRRSAARPSRCHPDR